MNPEYEVEEDRPQDVITGHFKQNISQIELAKKLARYHELKTEIEILEQRKEEIGKELKDAGKGVESLMAGDYAAFFTKVSGRASTDWKTAYKDAVGDMPKEDVSKYTKKGDDYIKMEVKKVR